MMSQDGRNRRGFTITSSHILITFMVISLILTACGQSEPADSQAAISTEMAVFVKTDQASSTSSLPVSSTLEPVDGMIPLNYHRFGIRVLLPEEWNEVVPGIFVPGSSQTGFPQLYYLSYSGLPLDIVTTSVILPRIGLTRLPESVGRMETTSLVWDLYIVEVQDPEIGNSILTFGLSESEAGSYIIALASSTEDYDRLRSEVYLPALRAFSPIEYGYRDHLTFDNLISSEDEEIQPVNNNYFMPIGESATALHPFEGTLKIPEFEMAFSNAEGVLIHPSQGFFPGFSVDFFTYDDYLVPVNRNIIPSSGRNSYWRIILSPGRIWSEPNDQGMSRASFPFVLVGPDFNEAHNGVATFLFNEAYVSDLRFQVVQETAAWNQTDFWGGSAMTYVPELVDSREELAAQFSEELSRQFPIQPWGDLRTKVNPDVLVDFNLKINPLDISATGLIWDGNIYLQPSITRYGTFPYPRYMHHGVFSVTKSMAAAVAMLRLAEKYGEDIYDLKIQDYVAITAVHDGWEDVTFGDALNMASGVGETPDIRYFTGDEDKQKFSDFMEAKSKEEKLSVVFSYANYDWGPGEQARYNSINTFVLSVAMQNFLKSKEGPDADIWDMVLEEVYKPIGIYHAPIMRTIEPDGSRGTPIFGYGLYPTVDDVAKVASLYQNGGSYQGRQLLHASKLAEALYQTKVQGFSNGGRNEYGESRYNYSFWSSPYQTSEGDFFQIPYMLGFGGNLVVLIPNGMTAFRFADAHIYGVETMIKAADSLKTFELQGD